MNEKDEMISLGMACVRGALEDLSKDSHIRVRPSRPYSCATCEGNDDYTGQRCGLCDYGSNYSPARSR